jgi:hypothetical protein
MKILKYAVLFGFTAVIRSSEIKTVETRRYFGPRLCAQYDVLKDGIKIDSNSTCGADWDSIERYIQYQLGQKQLAVDEANAEKAELRRLHHIKNDGVGKVITL